jgi:predicted nucleic acid-binding protein
MKPKLFLDTNIVLDLLGNREPFYPSIARVATLADKGEVTLVVSALSFATVSYFLTKYDGHEIAKSKLRGLKIITEVCALSEAIIDKALNADYSDYEDALQYYSALQSECDMLITRNGKDFKNAAIPVMTAEEFLASLGNKKSDKKG